MKVIFSKKTKDDFKKHRDYLIRKGKSDGHKYQTYELDRISKSLKENISKGIGNKKEHIDSIFPEGFKYNSKEYKMYVDKKSHHIVFYKIEQNSKGEKIIKIEKCIHSTELKKQLEENGIEPLENGNESLLKDLEDVYKEDEINQRDDSEEDEGKEEEIYDEKTGKKVKRKIFTGPRGGRFFIIDGGEKEYIKENKGEKRTEKRKTHLVSKTISLSDYIQKCIEEEEEEEERVV